MKSRRRLRLKMGVFGAAAVMMLGACALDVDEATTTSSVDKATTTSSADECAHVVDATVAPSPSGYRVTVTVLSGDEGWDRYADAWEVRDEDGTVLGTRVLAHPHVDEQPFTRSLDGVDIPAGVATVEIAARDSVYGFCGDTVEVAVPGG